MAHTPVAAWGGPDTGFQLAGQPPIERRPADDQLWDYAAGHRGFYGYLKVVDDRILQRTDMGLLDLSDHVWRGDYEQRVHPCEAADDAIANQAPNVGGYPCMTRHRMRLVERLTEEHSGDFLVEAPTPARAASILLQAHAAARERHSNLVTLPDGQSRSINPTHVVENETFCLLMSKYGEEIEEVEPDADQYAPAQATELTA